MDSSILRSNTGTRLVMIIEDLLEIIPKGLKCPAVLHANTAVKEHDKATKQIFNLGKPARTRKMRIEKLLSYRNIDDRYDNKKIAGLVRTTGKSREEKDIMTKAARL